MRTILVLLLGATLGLGCRDEHREAIESKCDAPLRQRAEELARSNNDGPLIVLGRTDTAIDDSRRHKLTRAGAKLGQVNGDLFTAEIPVRRLGDVAALEFVQSLQLSQTLEPLGR